jgi:hypothetical protein
LRLKLTIRHYFRFGSARHLAGDHLVRPDAWGGIYTAGPWPIPTTRDAWEREASADSALAERARAIDAHLRSRNVRTLASYGVGQGYLEYWLWRLQPERRLILTDFAPAAVERLGAVFPEANVLVHDMRSDAPLAADLHLLNCVDTEFSNGEWRSMLAERFRDSPVLVVACPNILTPRQLVAELKSRWRGTWSGWARTRSAFEALFADTHSATPVEAFDRLAWQLEPRSRS